MGDDGENSAHGLERLSTAGAMANIWRHCSARSKRTAIGCKPSHRTVYSRLSPLGRIYLPSDSYREMGDWSLPSDVSHQLITLRRTMDAENRTDISRFLHGGQWRNFMVKYDEINHMHKRM